jgi:hypothetical protein
MARIEKVEPYRASISRAALRKADGRIRVWSEPRSAVEGSEVLGEISGPLKVMVTEEQKELFSARPRRVRIVYGRKKQEGWVVSDVLTRQR